MVLAFHIRLVHSAKKTEYLVPGMHAVFAKIRWKGMKRKDFYSLPKADKIAASKEREIRRGPRKKKHRKPGLKTLKDRLLSHVRTYRQQKARLGDARWGDFHDEWCRQWMARDLKFIRVLAKEIRSLRKSRQIQ